MPQSWVVPFVYLAVILGFYLFSPEHRRPEIRARLLGGPNFYLATQLVLIVAAIVSTVFSRQHWLTALTWLVLAGAVAISIRRILAREEENGVSPDDEGR